MGSQELGEASGAWQVGRNLGKLAGPPPIRSWARWISGEFAGERVVDRGGASRSRRCVNFGVLTAAC